MTRIIWQLIKSGYIIPHIDLKDRVLRPRPQGHRDRTNDQVTIDTEGDQRLGVAVKCATITPNTARAWTNSRSQAGMEDPNGTIRALLGGTVFRAPSSSRASNPCVSCWKKPITRSPVTPYGDGLQTPNAHRPPR